jgi:hypothetical protein
MPWGTRADLSCSREECLCEPRVEKGCSNLLSPDQLLLLLLLLLSLLLLSLSRRC